MKESCVLKLMSQDIIYCAAVVSSLSKLSDFATWGEMGNCVLQTSAFVTFCFPKENPFRDLSERPPGNPRPQNTSVERVSLRLLIFPLNKSIFHSVW